MKEMRMQLEAEEKLNRERKKKKIKQELIKQIQNEKKQARAKTFMGKEHESVKNVNVKE